MRKSNSNSHHHHRGSSSEDDAAANHSHHRSSYRHADASHHRRYFSSGSGSDEFDDDDHHHHHHHRSSSSHQRSRHAGDYSHGHVHASGRSEHRRRSHGRGSSTADARALQPHSKMSQRAAADAARRQALLHSCATVIQRYFRGFITRLRTVDALRKLQLAFAIYQDLVTEYLQTEFLPDVIMYVITASSAEFAPQSRSGNRALEVSLAEELIKIAVDGMCCDIVREVLGAHVAVRLEAAQKTRPDALAFLSDFVIDAVVEQFARDIVLECTRERSREALFLLKEEREISRLWDDLITDEIMAGASAVIEECKAEQAALAKKAQPQATSFRLLGSFGGSSSKSVGHEALSSSEATKQPAELHSDA